MADNDDQEKSEVEPTLPELRSMLVVLQCSVNNILLDNQKLKDYVGVETISGHSRPRISKDERISVSKFLIWRQKRVAGIVLVFLVSPGRVMVLLF